MKKFVSILSFIFLMNCTENEVNKKFNFQNDSAFCNVTREFKNNIENQKGKLIYVEQKDKYAFKYNFQGTIDKVIYYFLCQKPDNININEKLIFSGKVFYFNEDENFNPPIGGLSYFYLKLTDINK